MHKVSIKNKSFFFFFFKDSSISYERLILKHINFLKIGIFWKGKYLNIHSQCKITDSWNLFRESFDQKFMEFSALFNDMQFTFLASYLCCIIEKNFFFSSLHFGFSIITSYHQALQKGKWKYHSFFLWIKKVRKFIC